MLQENGFRQLVKIQKILSRGSQSEAGQRMMNMYPGGLMDWMVARKTYVHILILGTCERDLIWKKGLQLS